MDTVPRHTTKFAPHNNLDQAARVVAAYTENMPVGCGCFRSMEESGALEIKRMYVVPNLRGRGIAGLILDELEVWRKEEGYIKSKLETGRNQPVYERRHCKPIPNYPPYVQMEESICMAKLL